MANEPPASDDVSQWLDLSRFEDCTINDLIGSSEPPMLNITPATPSAGSHQEAATTLISPTPLSPTRVQALREFIDSQDYHIGLEHRSRLPSVDFTAWLVKNNRVPSPTSPPPPSQEPSPAPSWLLDEDLVSSLSSFSAWQSGTEESSSLPDTPPAKLPGTLRKEYVNMSELDTSLPPYAFQNAATEVRFTYGPPTSRNPYIQPPPFPPQAVFPEVIAPPVAPLFPGEESPVNDIDWDAQQQFAAFGPWVEPTPTSFRILPQGQQPFAEQLAGQQQLHHGQQQQQQQTAGPERGRATLRPVDARGSQRAHSANLRYTWLWRNRSPQIFMPRSRHVSPGRPLPPRRPRSVNSWERAIPGRGRPGHYRSVSANHTR